MKTCLYNFDPLKPHFYIVKLGFKRVYIIFLISAQKHRLWVLVKIALLRRFYRVPTIYVLSRNIKKYQRFLSENFQFLEVKFSTYLHRHVFVMFGLGKSALFGAMTLLCCLPSSHISPCHPGSHPLGQFPFTVLHCSASRQLPHAILQFKP